MLIFLAFIGGLFLKQALFDESLVSMIMFLIVLTVGIGLIPSDRKDNDDE